MIPKIIHHIWVGGAPFPEEFAAFRRGWIDKHPDWEFKFWTNDKLPSMKNWQLYQNVSHPAAKSDILRLEVIAKFGGLYIDTDFECLKNVEPLLEGQTCVLARMTDKPITTGFIAAQPNDPLIQFCVDNLQKHINELPSARANNIYYQAGPGYIEKYFRDYNHIKVLEPHLVYPYEPRTPRTKALWKEKGAAGFPDSYAAHHWTGSWLKKK